MEFLRLLHKKDIAAEHTTRQQANGSNKLEAVRRLFRYSLRTILIGMFLIGCLWLFAWQQIHYEYDRKIEETSKETMNLTRAFEEHVRSVVANGDNDLLKLKQAYERGGSTSPIAAYIKAAKDPTINQVTVINEHGILGESLVEQSVGRDVSDREYFQFHRNSIVETLHIGKTIIGKTTGDSSIPLSRRINKPDGSFGGIVYIGLKTDYFLSFYQQMDLGPDKSDCPGWHGWVYSGSSNRRPFERQWRP